MGAAFAFSSTNISQTPRNPNPSEASFRSGGDFSASKRVLGEIAVDLVQVIREHEHQSTRSGLRQVPFTSADTASHIQIATDYKTPKPSPPDIFLKPTYLSASTVHTDITRPSVFERCPLPAMAVSQIW